jgi:hypothetical protein
VSSMSFTVRSKAGHVPQPWAQSSQMCCIFGFAQGGSCQLVQPNLRSYNSCCKVARSYRHSAKFAVFFAGQAPPVLGLGREGQKNGQGGTVVAQASALGQLPCNACPAWHLQLVHPPEQKQSCCWCRSRTMRSACPLNSRKAPLAQESGTQSIGNCSKFSLAARFLLSFLGRLIGRAKLLALTGQGPLALGLASDVLQPGQCSLLAACNKLGQQPCSICCV